MFDIISDNPMTNINWHRHRSGCPHYRERWPVDSNLAAGEPLYQVFCGENTPPVTAEEQGKCLVSHKECWRLKAAREQTRQASGTRRRPGNPAAVAE